MNNNFKQYRRTQITELRHVTDKDIQQFKSDQLLFSLMVNAEFKVSISDTDRFNGSPKIGDMIARNPENHNDQWLVAEKYFKDNFEPIEQPKSEPTEQVDESIKMLLKALKAKDDILVAYRLGGRPKGSSLDYLMKVKDEIDRLNNPNK